MNIIIVLIGLICLFLFIKLVEINPDKAFWIALLLVLDPGGYINEYVGKQLPGYLMTLDLFFPLLLIPLFSPKVNINSFFSDKYVRELFWYLVFISVYLVFIYGLIVPGNNLETWARFIYTRRYHIISPVLLIPAYLFSQRSLYIHYVYTIKTAVLVLTIYAISFFFRFDFVPMIEMERFHNSDMVRYIMPSNGHITLLILFCLVNILLRSKLPYQKQLFFSGVIMFLVLLLSLTRGTIISIVVQIVLTVLMMSIILKIPYLTSIWRNLIFFVIVMVIMVFLLPKQTESLKKTFSITYMELIGRSDEGISQSRTIYEIPRQIALFKKNPVWGAGYQPKLHQGGLVGESIDATDTPYIASWAMYGIVGTTLFLLLYYRVFRQIAIHTKLLRTITIDPITILYFVSLSSFFLTDIVFPNSIFSEYIKKTTLMSNCIIWGILYSQMKKIRISSFQNAYSNVTR